jgi:Xaa-Pro dipeptidase
VHSSELIEKTRRLQEMMSRENLGGVLLNAQHNFAWLTRGGSNGIDHSRENGASYLLVRSDGRGFNLANNIEMPRLVAEEIGSEDFEPVEFAWEAEKGSPDLVIEKAKALVETGSELVSDIPIHGGTRAVEGLIAPCRFSLTSGEIERYRALGADSGDVLGGMPGKIEPGETEIEIARKVRDELARRGIRAVVLLVAADERIASYRHPVPTEKRWEKVLLIACCARRDGLITSQTRIFCVGEIPVELNRRTEANAYVFSSLLAATRPGAKASDLYDITDRAYTTRGFPGEIRRHHQGGACGYKTRDWVAHPASGEVVQRSQAFAWNPSITGTKVEETCIAGADGVEIITASPGWPTITTEIGAHEYISPGILSL